MAASLGAAAITAGAGYLASRDANKKANKAEQAAQFNPFDVELPGLSAGINQETGVISGGLDQPGADIFNALRGGALSNLVAGNEIPFANQFVDQSGNQIINRFNEMQGQTGISEGATNFFSQAFGGAGNRANQQAIQNVGQANQLFGQAAGLFNTDFQNVADQRLALMREQAAPFEGRALTSLQDRMFGQGRLGSTGGGRDMEAFARGLGNADFQRQLQSQTFADTLRQQDRLAGLGLFNQSQGFNQAGQAGTRLAGDLVGMAEDTQFRGEENRFNRVGQRFKSAQDLFGFGQQTEANQLQTAVGQFTASQSIQDQLIAAAQLGGNLGGQQAEAGARSAQFTMQKPDNSLSGFFGNILGGIL